MLIYKNIDEHYNYFTLSTSENIFSINIPYPRVESFIKTCVTAPTSLPFCKMGDPDTTVVNMGQQIFIFFDNY